MRINLLIMDLRNRSIIIYKKDILDGDFRIEVIINSILDAKVYDTDTDEEYTNIHLVGK